MCHGQMIGAAMARIAGQDGARCSDCKRVIEFGEKYSRATCKQRGEFYVLAVCSDCHVPTARERWLARLKKLLSR